MLNLKQQRFCDEYLIDLNGKQAAIRAGYSPGCAEVTASRLLSQAKVREYIDAKRQKVSRKLEITLERYLEKQWAIGERFGTDEDYKAVAVASQAYERAAKAAGFLVDRSEQSGELTVKVVRE